MSDEDPSSTTPSTSTITNAAAIESYNRGPITKYWEPPTSCASTMSFDGNMYYGWGAAGIVDTACYPMGTLKSQEIVDATAWELYYYSPAVCPGGWDTVTKFTSGVPDVSLLTEISLGSDTSAVLCCPSDYEYSANGHVCTSYIKQGQTLDYVIPSTDIGGTLHLGNVTPSIYPSSSHAFANGVVVMWQSSDVSILRSATVNPNPTTATTTASNSGPTVTGSSTFPSNTSTPADSNTGAPTSTAQASPASSGLTTGAKVGIGIGIPLALLLGLAFGWFLFRRRKPYGSTASPPDYNESGMVKYAHTAAQPIYEAHSEPAEIGGNDQAHVDGKMTAHQQHQRHEM